MNMKWDMRFLQLADLVASWSKDPSTKAGAVITAGKRIVSMGFNGFPSGVTDSFPRLEDRDIKYKMVIHAEENAIMFASRSLEGCTLYVTHPPCAGCAGKIIQSGITTVITNRPNADFLSRWNDDLYLSDCMYREAGVKFRMLQDI